MGTFGITKSKLVKKLTESYISDNKSEIKEIVNIIKKDKEFRNLYLFYEDVENKFIDDPDTAKLYVEQISTMLSDKKVLVEGTCKKLNSILDNVIIEENKTYDALDQLLDIDTLRNLDKKVVAKKNIVKFITTEKPIFATDYVTESTEFTGNELLLHTIMTNNFNSYYDTALNEEEKDELRNILSLDNDELNSKVDTLKESILNKITSLVTESKDDTLVQKLIDVKEQVKNTEVSKYSFYKLTNLLKDME
jgi:hypothetical protein